MADDCLLYAGRLTSRGYARVWIHGREVALHRAMYEKFVGPVADGYELHHRCGIRHCINPAHLEAVTHTEHMRLHDPLRTREAREKPYCRNGHARTPENLYVAPKTGLRACRICRRNHRRAYAARLQAA